MQASSCTNYCSKPTSNNKCAPVREKKFVTEKERVTRTAYLIRVVFLESTSLEWKGSFKLVKQNKQN